MGFLGSTRAVALTSSLVAIGHAAHAEPEPPAAQMPPVVSEGSSTPRNELDRTRALVLFDQAKEQYRLGRFRESAVLLNQAWLLAREPVLIYNLARSCENAGYLTCASESYADYIKLDPSAPDLAAIQIRLRVLNAQIAAREAAGQPAIAPWIIAGTGVLGVGAAIALGVVATNTHEDAVSEPIQIKAIALQEDAETFATASTVTYVASGVVTAAGLAWGIVDLSSLGVPKDSRVDISLRGPSLSVSVDF
jgi:tetratricopeptide (TPR) repeat protein